MLQGGQIAIRLDGRGERVVFAYLKMYLQIWNFFAPAIGLITADNVVVIFQAHTPSSIFDTEQLSRGRNVCRAGSEEAYRGRASFEELSPPPSSRHAATMTLLTSFLHATNFSNPFLRTLVPSIGLAFGIQGAAAIPSIIAKNERFYDLSGSLTYVSCTALSLFLPAIRARNAARLTGAPLPAWPSLLSPFNGTAGVLGFNWRQVALSAAVTVWATRRKSLLQPSNQREKLTGL